jgi:DNA-binding transcriptional ArsR family regulator
VIAAERAAVSSNGGSETGRLETPLDRVLRALNHPLRRRILRALVDESSSASELSKDLGVALGVISYHLNRVLARECEVVELVKEVPRRGATEKFYRLGFQALSEGEAPRGPGAMSLEERFIVAVTAMEAGAGAPPASVR